MPFVRFVLSVAIALLLADGRRTSRFPDRQVGGTFIGAVIAADGIVVASDSRSTFLEKDGRPIGYVDGIQKIYVSQTTAVAASGLTSIQGELFHSFVERNSFLMNRPAEEVLHGFSSWLPFQNSTNLMLLSAGFSKGKPVICARSVVQPQSCQDTGSITNKPSASIQTWVSALKRPPNASAAAAALKQAIQETAAVDTGVGGSISIVQLRFDGPPVWIENQLTNRWTTICELVRDYRSGKVRITPTSSRQQLDQFLASTCSRSIY